MAFFVLFAHRWTIKPLAIIFIVLSTSVTYFISKYNVAIDRTMVMNLIHTDSTEVQGLLSAQMVPYLIFMILLPSLAVARVNITFHNATRYLLTSLIFIILSLAIGAGFVYHEYTSIHRAANISNKYIIHTLVPVNYIRSIASAVHKSVKAYNRKNRQEVEITGRVVSQDDLVVVLAIGETSRQKNFTLYGYERRNTNPVLSKDADLHILNGKARIGTTYLALLEILDKNDIKLPAITSKLGIDTACYVNYHLNDNCDAVGEVHVSNCGRGGKCYDEDVIPLLEDGLRAYSSGYKFVILHLGGGSHGPLYKDRMPEEFQLFRPICQDADVVNQCSREELYNSYDNTILYVDYVLGEIIGRLDSSKLPYVFIYLSDHGESLLEEGRIFHGMPPGIPLPPEQAQVPLIVKSSIPISISRRDEYEQADVFDSVLDLLSIETDSLDKTRGFIKKK
ncbi:MAG: phosphoethanolamine transferase [Gammaproteobacteria bacterium]|nr:phosphoethanolamine transferase [Gammaproteobacteria bacterium]